MVVSSSPYRYLSVVNFSGAVPVVLLWGILPPSALWMVLQQNGTLTKTRKAQLSALLALVCAYFAHNTIELLASAS